jgi:hypothetical protein
MQNENSQAGLDVVHVWRAAQHERSEDVGSSDVDILRTVAAFCGVGLLLSVLFVMFGLDMSVGGYF